MNKFLEDISLVNYSTFGIGGNADFLTVANNKEDLIDALNWAKKTKIKFVVIGNGSNVLFADSGFLGLVIINRANGYQINKNRVMADSGAKFAQIANKTLRNNLVGLHFGSGIPGTVGGAIVGNAGALGWDIAKTFVSADIWRSGKVEEWQNADFDFDYRYSKLKNNSDAVILDATFELERDCHASLAMIKEIQDDKERRGRSYIGKTSGSYFKNPGDKSAGELIDQLGLKGYRVGDAEISPLHANVIRNAGNAKASDVLKLEKYIQDKVHKKYKIRLEPEIVKIGF